MAIEVFNRYENKFMLNEEQYQAIMKELPKYMEEDAYCRNGGIYTIANIYYDTENDAMIRKSLQKPPYKEKVRMRAYGTPDGKSTTFVEIKKKYNHIVNKRRVTMTYDEAMAYMTEDVHPDNPKVNKQVLRELDYMKEFYHLVPKLYLSYDRQAFFGKDDHEFRLTFDNNIQTRRYDLNLSSGPYGEQLLPPGMRIMEIKISQATPQWFVDILSANKIYQTSFSKYGTEYKNYVKNNFRQGENVLCSNQYSLPQTQVSKQGSHCCA